MNGNHDTRPSLLLRIRDSQDQQSWQEFAEIYAPLIHRFILKQGLQDADAEDLTQDVLSAVSRSIGRLDYDRRLGKFRTWLFQVARNKTSHYWLNLKKQPRGSGDSAVHQMLDCHASTESEDQAFWDFEYEQRLFHWAAEKVKSEFQPASWTAFWKTSVENQSAADVASELGITVGAVYIAKSRVLARLRLKIQELGE